MEFENLVIAGMRTSEGERFLVGAQARGALLTDESVDTAPPQFPPPLDHSQRKALERAGIRPYTLMPESVLRAGLSEFGLSEEEIEKRFAAARKLISTVTETRSYGGSH